MAGGFGFRFARCALGMRSLLASLRGLRIVAAALAARIPETAWSMPLHAGLSRVRWMGVMIAVLVALLLPVRLAPAQDAASRETIYRAWCLECHGAEGRGDGPAATHMLPRPRDFVGARYQIRTTASGELPTDDDLMKVMRDGLPGTAMPGWPNLSDQEKRDVVAYIKSFSPFFERETPEVLQRSADPGGGADRALAGREVYGTLECARCHGEQGRGDGRSAPTLEDWRGFPVRAADLSEPWLFNGGMGADAIHTRFLTGVDGTPMPSNQDALEAGVVTEEDLWDLAHYVAGLGPAEAPELEEVVRVERREQLPDGPADEAWDDLPRFYFPLVGQIVEAPRQFAPTVDGVWVQGVHDGAELALRVEWHDPSNSPDTGWQEWQDKIAGVLYSDESPIPTEPLPDLLAVQFPMSSPNGRGRPYFLMGDGRDPVYLWLWHSRRGAVEGRATGLGTAEVVDSGAGLTASAEWEAGRWRVVFRRPLAAADDGMLSFSEGAPIPIAFFAWDGSSGETGTRGSISAWYFVGLQPPPSNAVFMAPLVAFLVTGGLGMLAVRRAQKSYRG
jgi:DMSO reductase family type II enzyme heme b subunit